MTFKKHCLVLEVPCLRGAWF